LVVPERRDRERFTAFARRPRTASASTASTSSRRGVFIQKDRRRWRILFRGTEFYLNLDRVEQPDLGYFIEAKSRTWSRRDAEHKAELAHELIVRRLHV